MAKQFWEDDAPVASGQASSDTNFWEGDADAAKQDLPKDVKPSTAGGGRGSVNPPRIMAALSDEELNRPAGALGRSLVRTTPDKRSLVERSVEDAPPEVQNVAQRQALIRQQRRENWQQEQISAGPSATGTTRPRDDTDFNRGAEFATSGIGSIPGARAVAKAGTGIAQGIGGMAQAVGDVTGIDTLAQAGKATAEGAQAFEKGMGKGGDIEGFGPRSPVPYLAEQAEGAASSLGQSAVLAAGVGAKSVIATQAALQGGQSYSEARQAGLNPAAALARAIPQGAFEAIGEKFTGLDRVAGAMGTLLQRGAGDAAKRTAADVLVRAGIKEIPGEVLTYLGQTGTDLIPGIGLNPNMTMEQFLDGLRDTVVQAGMMGGAVGAGGVAAGGRARAPSPTAATQPLADQQATTPAAPAAEAAVVPDSPVPAPVSSVPPAAVAAPLTNPPAAAPVSSIPQAEPPADVAAQIEAIRSPGSGKTAALITPGTPANDFDLTGLHVVPTKLGTFVTSDLDAARDVATLGDTITDDQMGLALGYTTPRDQTDGTVVQALDADGNVVHEEETNAENLPTAATQALGMAPVGGAVVQTDVATAGQARAERMPGALTRAAQAVGAVTPEGRPTAMNDPKARPKTMAERQEAMAAVSQIEAEQDAQNAFEAAMLADEVLPDLPADSSPSSTTPKGAQDAQSKPTAKKQAKPAIDKIAAPDASSNPAPRAKTAPAPAIAPAQPKAPRGAEEVDGGGGRPADAPASAAVARSADGRGQPQGDGRRVQKQRPAPAAQPALDGGADSGVRAGRVNAPPAPRAPDRAEPATDAPSEGSRATYESLAAATAYIRQQRARGSNVAAAAFVNDDGEIVVATKGTPDYERALDQRQARLKGEKDAARPTSAVPASPAGGRRAGRDSADGSVADGRGADGSADGAVPGKSRGRRASSVAPAPANRPNASLTPEPARTAPEHAGVDGTGPKTSQFTSEALTTARSQVEAAATEWAAFSTEHADQLEGKNKKRKPKASAPQAVKDRFDAYVRMRDAASDAYNAALKAEKLGVAAGQPKTTTADVIDGRVPMTISTEAFKVVTDEFATLFADPEPGEVVRMADKAKPSDMLTPEQAKARIEQWKAHAKAQFDDPKSRRENASKTVLSLFDLTGEWSRPWEEAGYNVQRFDIQSGQDVFDFSVEYFTENYDLTDVYAILAATPCTDFASSGAKHFLKKDAAGQTEQSVKLVSQTAATIEYFRPPVWSLENPVGRIQNLTGLPDPRLSFDPNHFGDPYTKKTMIWGNFNADLPAAPVEPTEGSKMHSQFGGKSIETKNARSETPEGFAYAFFMANNYIDRPADQKLAAEYPEASGAVQEALKAGVTEERIHELMENTYGNYEYDEARTVLAEEVAKMRAEATATPLDAAANEAATSAHSDAPAPTTAQKIAGNYKMGHLSGEQTQGIDITIENPKDSVRSGTAPDGTAWSNTMGAHYGYAKRSLAADGDHVDVFVGPAADRAPTVYVIDQVNADGTYDEAKAMLGYMNKAAALKAYRSSYSKGWKVGPVTAMPVAEFKAGLESGRFKKPIDPSLAAPAEPKIAKLRNSAISAQSSEDGEQTTMFSVADQTDSPAFKKWFGDSKVVDSSGKPRVLYHGTNQDFTRFDASRNGQNTKARSSIAFFATENPSEANEYAEMAGRTQIADATAVEKRVADLQRQVEQAEKRGDWDKAERLYLEMEEADLGAINADPSGQNVMPLYASIKNPMVIDMGNSFDADKVVDAIKVAQDGGFDGLKLENVYDPVGDRQDGFSTTQWVGFKPSQLKSAIGNRGTFSSKSADLRMRTAEGAPTPVKTKPASSEHERKAARLLDNLRAGQDSFISFQAVEPDDATDAGKMLAAVRLTAKRLFGHDVVFVRFNGPAAFNGAMSTSAPNTVFVRADSSKPHMAILGHELLHSLRQQSPGLYAAMEQRLNQLTNDQTTGYYRELKAKYEAIGRDAPEGDKLREELYADIVGDHFLDPKFWDGMAADQRGLFRRVADAIVRFLDRIIKSLASSNALGTKELLKDAEEARRVVIAGMRAFSEEARARTGLAPLPTAASLSATTRKPAAATEFTRKSRVKHVVFHATNADFDTFDTSRSDLGAHFGTVEQANKVAATRLFGREPGAAPNIMPVYIDLRSPLRLKDVGTFHADGIAPQLAAKGWMTKAEANAMVAAIDRDWNLRPKFDKQVRELIEEHGYDGVVYRNGHEGEGDSYIVFHANQVKSATGNRGTFDRESDDIRMSAERRALTDTPAFKKWFGDSKVVDDAGKPLVVYHGTIVRDSARAPGMGDITAFDRMFTTKFRAASLDTVGSWFSTNPGEGGAGMYSGNNEGSAIYPVYLAIKNPQVTTFQLLQRRARMLQNGKDDGRPIGAPEVAAYRKWLADMGKDGIKIEGSGNDGSTEFDNQVAWIALEPSQIKSATGNAGTFNPESDDIRLSAADIPKKSNPALTRAIFGGSMEYMRDQNGKPVKAKEQIEKYKAIDPDERGQMLLRLGHVTADQLKRWKASPLDMFNGAVNSRFRKHFETPGIVWRDNELRDIFKLDDEGIAAYRALRAQADESLARHAVADMLRLAGPDGLAVRDRVLSEPMDVAAITLRDHLLALGTADPARNKLLTDRANAVIDLLDQANDDMGGGRIPDDMKAEARPNPWESTDPTFADRVIYEMQDGRIDLKRTQEAIEKSGAKVREEFDARLAETLYSGRVAKRTQTFLEDDAKPLLQAMALQGIGQIELGDYLHARAAPERNAQIAKVNPDMPDGGAGANSTGLLLTTDAARQYIADIPEARREKLEALAQRVDVITKGTRALLVAEGLEKADTIAAWEAVYKTYVPMFREDVEFSRITTSKRATGSEKKAVNILANVLLQREAAITRAEKNRVKVALYGLALSNPNPKFWVTIRPETDRAQMLEDVKSMGIDPVEAEAGMASPPTITSVDPATNLVTEQLNPFFRNLPTAINLKINGENRVLLLNEEDPRALRMAEALKGADGLTKFDLAGTLIGKTTRWLAAVNTQYNPVFGVVNFLRDTMGGVIHLGNTPLRGHGTQVVAGLPGAIRGIGAHLAGNEDSGKWSKLFEQFQQDGGQTGFREMFADGTRRAEAVEKDLKRMSQGRADPRRVARGLMSLLSGFNEVTENAVRLSAYATALDTGMSRPEAARLARELTVDFNRKGRATREIGPLYAFFNAAIQGNERTLRALRGPTGKYIIAGGLALGVAQALMLAAAGYDEDEIPEYAKARALVIPLFDKDKSYILIPLPLGLHVIPNTGRAITEMVIGNRKNLGKKTIDAIGEISGAFNPLGGGNIFTMDGALRTIAPTVIDPLIELGFNKNFAGTPIERESRGETDIRPGHQRARERTQRTTTGQAYLGISKAINSMTGGTDYEAGAISPTAERLRYLGQVALGGVLRETEKIIDSSTAAARGEKVSPAGVPVAGRFFGKVDNERTEQSRYFDNSKRINKVEAAEKAARKAGDADRVEAIRNDPLFQFIRPGNRVDAAVRKLNKLAVQVVGNKEEQEAIDKARTDTMRELNEAIRDMEAARRGPTIADRLKVAK